MSQPRRIRHEMGDAVVLMVFSVGVATALTAVLALLARLL
jgi:hypothetical protein